MPLSEDEQRILQEIERNFYDSDPAFAREVSTTTLYRHQLAAQLMNGGDADFSWIVRLNHSLQQSSGHAMLQLAWTPGENWQLWANALQHYGDAHDRDGGPMTRMVWLGLTVFLR